MRMMRTGAPATVASLQPMNGSAASETSAPSQAAASRSRDRGPATAAPAHWVGDRGEVHVEVRPDDLCVAFEMGHHHRGMAGAGGEVVLVVADPGDGAVVEDESVPRAA